MILRKTACIISAAALTVQLPSAHGLHAKSGGPSRYVQCDGQPNNTTAGETAARLLGALTLLALFAPSPEAPNPRARKFGQEGVEVCNSLLEGDKDIEGNPVRRLELILGRALHRIEAGHYQAAIADVELARKEATEQGFMADPYFSRSFARSFPRIEAEAMLRMRQFRGAQEKLLAENQQSQFSFIPVLTTATYSGFLRESTAGEDALLDAQSRLSPFLLVTKAERFEILGRFAEAAKARESLNLFGELFNNPNKNSFGMAHTALSHALAGNWAKADQWAAAAKDNIDKGTAERNPKKSRAQSEEILTLFKIVKMAKDGNFAEARKEFAAGQDWGAASFGAVMSINALLRKNAAPQELIGALAKGPDQLWLENVEANLAEKLASDKDNETLFFNIHSMNKASDYERLSRAVWETKKSTILSREKWNMADPQRFDGYLATLFGAAIAERFDAFLLHAALVAQERGYKKFIFNPELGIGGLALVHFVEPENEERYAEFSLDAGKLVAELAPAIPDPQTLKQIKAERKRNKKRGN